MRMRQKTVIEQMDAAERIRETLKWLGARGGKIGGKSTSQAKAAAARANGRKGGRPRKVKA